MINMTIVSIFHIDNNVAKGSPKFKIGIIFLQILAVHKSPCCKLSTERCTATVNKKE
jgi:hypothetical protein